MSSLSVEDRRKLLSELSEQEAEALLYDWRFWARPNQLAPNGDWRYWLILAGRGFGKTRAGAEWVREEVQTGRRGRLAFVARTAADTRDVMVEEMSQAAGSGILQVSPPWFRPEYEPSKRRLTWPNGATATLYSSDEPDLLRGPQHDGAWADELAAWQYPQAWDMLMMGLRLGNDPRAVITTTPKATQLIKELIKDPMCVVTKGSTYDNLANLAPSFLNVILRKYEGTRLGRQELYAEILDDVEGALWTHDIIDNLRVDECPDLIRIVVAIDPQGAHRQAGQKRAIEDEVDSETGIVVAGVARNGHCYVLADLSVDASPDGWASRAVNAYHDYKADRICAEVNFGGDMVLSTIRTADRNVPVTKLHASRGKLIRAEPIAALYEQGRVHHVGSFPQLEDQMCNWVPGDSSPDRLDALVWALTEVGLGGRVSTEFRIDPNWGKRRSPWKV